MQTISLLNASTLLEEESVLPHAQKMYAIAFDLDQETLKQTYGSPSYTNAYGDIRKHLLARGFDAQQGSVYFGRQGEVDAVRCVLAVQELSRTFSWFAASVSDIRMLRIEENNDLRPAVELGS